MNLILRQFIDVLVLLIQKYKIYIIKRVVQSSASFFIFCFTDFFCNKLGSEDEIKIKFIRTVFQLN